MRTIFLPAGLYFIAFQLYSFHLGSITTEHYCLIPKQKGDES